MVNTNFAFNKDDFLEDMIATDDKELERAKNLIEDRKYKS